MARQLKITEKKSGRRGNNEGTIYERKDGKWCAQITTGYKEDGKLIRKTLYGSSRQEVAKKLTNYIHDVFENGYTSIAASDNRIFNSLLEEWYITFKAPTIKSATISKHRNYLKNHIYKAFGELTVEQIDIYKMQRFFNSLSKKGLALQSIKHIKNLLDQFYKHMLSKKIIKANPLEEIKIRQTERYNEDKAQMALSQEHRSVVFSALADNPVLKPILITLAFTRLRPGELIALKWKNIDLDKATISVETAAAREYEFDDEGNIVSRKQVISNTKTVLSVRSFIAPEIVIENLRAWRDYQKEMELTKGIDFTSKDKFVFSTKNGEMRKYSGLRSSLVRFVEKAGLKDAKINLYTFRHTFATMLLEERENPKIVSELMGHAKVITTLSIYSHVIASTVYEDTAKKLNGAYEKYISANKN